MTERPLAQTLAEALAGLRQTPADALDAASREQLQALVAAGRQCLGETPRGERERTLQAHFDYALNGILEVDGDGRIVDANPAAASICQLARRQLLGRRFADLFAATAAPQVADHLALLAEQGILTGELPMDGEDGLRCISLSSVQVDEQRYVHVFDDVTADRRLAQALVEARQAAEAANEAKSRFLANVSHEIRTPMNGIIGLTQLALMDGPSPEQRDTLEKIAQSGRTLLGMLNDLLDFAKIEAGKLEYEQRPVDWHAVLDELAVIAVQAIGDKPVDLLFDPDPAMPRHIVSDPLRLKQILINLLGNAAKFTDRGRITVRLAVDGDQLRVAVSDTGCGIQPHALGKLFQPFVQEDAGTTRRFGGTGLGLAIARQLARGLGGDLGVHSTPDIGSTFTLHLPLSTAPADADSPALPAVAISGGDAAQRQALTHLIGLLGGRPHDGAEPALRLVLVDDEAAIRAELARPPAAGQHRLLLAPPAVANRLRRELDLPASTLLLGQPLTPAGLLKAASRLLGGGAPVADDPALDIPTEFRGACVAVAEDMAVNQQVICGLLERAGIRVLLADNGRQLLDRLASSETPPELFLMDIHMPELDGMATTRALREAGYRQPVVALSAGVGKGEQADCLAAGMNDFLGKPIDLDELWGVLTCWLPPRRPASPPQPAGTPVPADAAPPTVDRRPAATALPAWLGEAGVNAGPALQRFLGNGEALLHGIRLFLKQHASTPARLTAAIAGNDRHTFRLLAHAVGGSAQTIGAEALASVCHEAEHLASAAWPARAEALQATIACHLQRLLEGQSRAELS